MTSFAFMLVEVPAPPWMTSTTNWSCNLPSRISPQARAIAVGERRRLLDCSKRADQLGVDRDRHAADREVLDRAQCMDAVVDRRRNGERAKEVVLEVGLGCGAG